MVERDFIEPVDEQNRHWIGLRALEIAAVIIGAALTLLMMGGQIYTKSGDLALHYGFTLDIAETWNWPLGDKPWTSGMGAYPPLSHYVAAVIGTAIGSPFTAITSIALLCVYGCYLLLLRSLINEKFFSSIAALLLALGGIFAIRNQDAAPGFELFLNFFYAQLFGELIFLAFALWLATSLRDRRALLVATAAMTFLCGWLYPITSIKIALAYLSIEAIAILRRMIIERRLQASWLTNLVIGGIVLPLLVVFHPTFRYMTAVAANNGSLDVGILNNLVPTASAALIVTCIAMACLARDSNRWHRGGLFLTTAGLAAGGAALAQYIAYLITGSGSDYAIKKHVYSVIALLIFCIAWSVVALVKDNSDRRLGGQWVWRILSVMLPPAASLLAILFLPREHPDSLNAFLQYQNFVESSVAAGLPADASGNTASRNQNFAWSLNHAITLDNLKMEFRKAIRVAESNIDPSKPKPEKYAFINDLSEYVAESCIVLPDRFGDVVLASLPCIAESAPILRIGQEVDMAASRIRPPYFHQGWSKHDETGIWSTDRQASLVFRIAGKAPLSLVLSMDATAFLPKADMFQRVHVLINGVPLTTWEFNARNQGSLRSVALPPGAIQGGSVTTITFQLPDARHPQREDPRVLGIFVKKFSIAPLHPPYRIGDEISVAAQPGSLASLHSGWSAKEPTGVWTDGSAADFVLALDGDASGPLRLDVVASSFLPISDLTQKVIVEANGIEVASWTFNAQENIGPRTAIIPPEAIHDNELKVRFRTPNATSPAELKLSNDTRRLGMFLMSYKVSPVNSP